jgi:hypothetical protein
LLETPKSENPEELFKQCPDCGETKIVSEFPKNIDKPGGYARKCKRCTNYDWQRYRKIRVMKKYGYEIDTKMKRC